LFLRDPAVSRESVSGELQDHTKLFRLRYLQGIEDRDVLAELSGVKNLSPLADPHTKRGYNKQAFLIDGRIIVFLNMVV